MVSKLFNSNSQVLYVHGVSLFFNKPQLLYPSLFSSTELRSPHKKNDTPPTQKISIVT